ncbi:MAG TPA: hypothetical protein VH392_08140, partial [Sphingomicrobium sp.]
PKPEKLAELPLIIDVDNVTEVAQAPSQIHSTGGLDRNPGVASASKASKLLVDALQRSRTGRFMEDRTKAIDDANPGSLHTHIEAGPKSFCHIE